MRSGPLPQVCSASASSSAVGAVNEPGSPTVRTDALDPAQPERPAGAPVAVAAHEHPAAAPREQLPRLDRALADLARRRGAVREPDGLARLHGVDQRPERPAARPHARREPGDQVGRLRCVADRAQLGQRAGGVRADRLVLPHLRGHREHPELGRRQVQRRQRVRVEVDPVADVVAVARRP